MTFIDWTDPEEMVGLLSAYVADEWCDSQADRDRERFLFELSKAVDEVVERQSGLSTVGLIAALKTVRRSQPPEFAGDPVLEHVDACIAELERIEKEYPSEIDGSRSH